jgi:hypothetical protein
MAQKMTGCKSTREIRNKQAIPAENKKTPSGADEQPTTRLARRVTRPSTAAT